MLVNLWGSSCNLLHWLRLKDVSTSQTKVQLHLSLVKLTIVVRLYQLVNIANLVSSLAKEYDEDLIPDLNFCFSVISFLLRLMIPTSCLLFSEGWRWMRVSVLEKWAYVDQSEMILQLKEIIVGFFFDAIWHCFLDFCCTNRVRKPSWQKEMKFLYEWNFFDWEGAKLSWMNLLVRQPFFFFFIL